MRKLLLLTVLGAAAASAQISLGVMAGAPFTSVVHTTTISGVKYLSESPNFTVGASFQLGLPARLRLELDAIYRPASFSASNLLKNITAADLRFPVIMQYRLKRGGIVKPYLGLGASFDHLYQIRNAVTSGPGSIMKNSPAGLLLNGGLDFDLKLVRLSTELRYTRQWHHSILDLSQLNQAEFMLGIHF